MSLLYAENATTGKGGNMPGNTVIVNNALEWYVGDSKMDEVIGLLNKVGFREPVTDSVQAGPIDDLVLCENCGTAL